MDVMERPSMQMRPLQMGSFRMHLGVLRKSCRGEALPFHESLMLIKGINEEFGTSLRMIRPHVADVALADASFRAFFQGCDCFATSAVVAYAEPNKPLGREISFGANPRFRVSTAAYHIDRNLAVVATEFGQSGITVGPEEVVICSAELRAVPIPAASGWSLQYDRQTGIPKGVLSPRMPDGDSRYLWRALEGPYAGPLVREPGPDGERARVVSLCCATSSKFGVVVEVPEHDAPAFIELPKRA